MPAAYAHYVFGHRVVSALPKGAARDAVLSHLELFEIGLQGPDILFFFHPLTHPPLNRLGHNMHEESPLNFLSREICRNASGGGLSYLLGFICHYALDSECHTAVEYYMDKTGRGHSEIETDFERILMQKDGNDPYNSSAVSYIHNDQKNAAVIAPFFDARAKEIHTALTTMKLVDKLLTPSSDIKHRLLRRVGRWMGEGSIITELTMDRVPDPIYDSSNQELLQTLKSAVPVAVVLMDNFVSWQRGDSSLSQRFKPTFSFDPMELARRKERDKSV